MALSEWHVHTLLVLVFATISRCDDEGKIKHLLNETISKNDPDIRPHPNGPPVNVSINVHVVSFGSISEQDMEYTMDIYLRQFWHDARTRFNDSLGVPYLTVTAKALSEFWLPDLYFVNEKKGTFHQVTKLNKLLKIFPNGDIIYSVRLALTLSCPMDLSNFPMDRQECGFQIESYGHDITDMLLLWASEVPGSNRSDISFNDEVELPQFAMVHHYPEHCDKTYNAMGRHACLAMQFIMKRQFGFYVLQTYIPTILIVILSWVSFWINAEAIPARISLGVTTVLTMTTQLSGSKANMPRVSYPKALDVWMSTCMIFVFGALLEYAFVNSFSRKTKRYGDTIKKSPSNLDPQVAMRKKDSTVSHEDGDGPQTALSGVANKILHYHQDIQMSRRLDKYSRILFPGIFSVFATFYWTYYLWKHNHG